MHRIITDLAVIDVTEEELVLRELAPGISAREIQEKTEPRLLIPSDVIEMSFAAA